QIVTAREGVRFVAVGVVKTLAGRLGNGQAVGLNVLAGIARVDDGAAGSAVETVGNGDRLRVELPHGIAFYAIEGPEGNAVAGLKNGSQLPAPEQPARGTSQRVEFGNLVKQIHDQVLADIEVGKAADKSQIPPGSGRAEVAGKIVASKTARGSIHGLAPGEGAHGLQAMAHVLGDAYLQRVVIREAGPEGGLDGIDVGVDGMAGDKAGAALGQTSRVGSGA